MAKTIMIQGTTSDAGKSVMVTGLCRYFLRKGIRVAPFKPQNMALNSAVTVNGGEIGRSQAVQAQACGIEPHTDMNPILLKPNTDKGAQVIINGHFIGNLEATEFHQYKATAIKYALDAYHRLAERYDLIIVEGAGSPAEINLRHNDVANMGFATAIDCPVLLVSDIDRGGVFAHLTGTLGCLEPNEKKLIKGFLINRFRGDKSLLNSGIDWLTEKTKIPTLGVLPYLKNLHIESEDSIDTRDYSLGDRVDGLKIVVPRLPRISNHTDFDVLRLNPDIELNFIGEMATIPSCDLVILPGSKNTIADLSWLEKNNWFTYIRKHLRYGGKLLGICGGYQMLGSKIHDPLGLEGAAGSAKALGLLEFETTLEPIKQLENVEGHLIGSNAPVRGYEIHIGTNTGPALKRAAISLGNRLDGVVSEDNQIMGTYLHGVFDHDQGRQALLEWAGLLSNFDFDYQSFREKEIDRVADMLEFELNHEELVTAVSLEW